MRQPNEVITAQIPRTELLELLDAMTPVEQQRVTAEMAATMPLEDDDEVARIVDVPRADTSSLDVVVRFTKMSMSIEPRVIAPPVATRPLPHWAIVLGSCVVIALLGLLMMAAA